MPATPNNYELLRAWSPKSYLCVPLIARGRTLGAITLVTAESGRRYGDADLELAEELAGRAALAVDNARLYDETRARAERESLINKIGQTLRGSLDPDRVLEDATAAVGQALGVSRCLLVRLTPARDYFEIAPRQFTAPGVHPSVVGLAFDGATRRNCWRSGRRAGRSPSPTSRRTRARPTCGPPARRPRRPRLHRRPGLHARRVGRPVCRSADGPAA